MQLRAYLAILRRFWPIILLLPLLAGGISLGLALRQPARYQATVRLMVTRSPLDAGASGVSLPALNDSYSWTTTDFILDDLALVVSSAAFAQDISAAVGDMSPASIQGGLSATVLHRSVYLSAVADTPEQALAVLAAATDALRTKGLSYWGRGAGGLDVATLDPPQAAGTVGGPRAALTGAALRAALGLAVAVGLAMLIHYLDDRLRSPAQAEQWTGVRVIASIPKE
ncbi:lipopolysaccharide biosynthesis protein [Oscillochloris sp. ZM17-4]|uniref:lipopolysaccharide biosynthesis protein n=1 Tax=Oscillochloris sp. ZM17-4 TaxID=2866714 RepID=UPI001C737254|nr:lipopolysaccharide biosynthesis protein [Oscillochloris sp. ZM17-4]MBX0328294.1 lipopolysaccharide biosynthesis protein [Oscillochloris sp. ZM17-4]